MKTTTAKPDGGWGWVIVLASFAIQIIGDGVANAHGVIFVYLIEEFGESKGQTAWVGSIFSGVPLLSGPIAAALAEQYGCRPITILGGLLSALGFGLSVFATSVEFLCVTLGLIAGFGLSLVYVTSMLILVRWFNTRLSFAMGIASAGSGLGLFIFGPFIGYLCVEYGLYGTFLILAGVFLNLIVFGALMREPKRNALTDLFKCDADSESESETLFDTDDFRSLHRRSSSIEIPSYCRPFSGTLPFTTQPMWREMRQLRRLLLNIQPLRSIRFCLFCLANLILYLVVDVPCDFAVANAITHDINSRKAAFLLSIIGIATITGQPVYGYLGDRLWCNSLGLFTGSILLAGGLTATVPLLVSYETLAVYSGMFGFLYYGSIPLFGVILVDVVGEEHFSGAFGLLYFAQGFATLFANPIAGYLFDKTGDYDMSFYTAGAGMGLAAVMLLLYPILRGLLRCRHREADLNYSGLMSQDDSLH